MISMRVDILNKRQWHYVIIDIFMEIIDSLLIVADTDIFYYRANNVPNLYQLFLFSFISILLPSVSMPSATNILVILICILH